MSPARSRSRRSPISRQGAASGSGSRSKLSPEQAYILCSVACDLKISNLVDVPNYVVSNFLQLDVFDQDEDDD